MEDVKYIDLLISAIVSGDQAAAIKETKNLLAAGVPGKRIIVDAIEAAMEQLDDKCTVEQFNLLEIMLSGRAVNAALKLLFPEGETTESDKGTVILGALEGDVHDIGKNILKMVLNAKGYRIIDCGTDCPAEKFIQLGSEYMPLAIGVSGLITTVIPQLRQLRAMMDKAGLKEVKLLAGGAAMKQSTAENLNVDFLAQNTFDGLKYLNQLSEKNA